MNFIYWLQHHSGFYFHFFYRGWGHCLLRNWKMCPEYAFRSQSSMWSCALNRIAKNVHIHFKDIPIIYYLIAFFSPYSELMLANYVPQNDKGGEISESRLFFVTCSWTSLRHFLALLLLCTHHLHQKVMKRCSTAQRCIHNKWLLKKSTF